MYIYTAWSAGKVSFCMHIQSSPQSDCICKTKLKHIQAIPKKISAESVHGLLEFSAERSNKASVKKLPS